MSPEPKSDHVDRYISLCSYLGLDRRFNVIWIGDSKPIMSFNSSEEAEEFISLISYLSGKSELILQFYVLDTKQSYDNNQGDTNAEEPTQKEAQTNA